MTQGCTALRPKLRLSFVPDSDELIMKVEVCSKIPFGLGTRNCLRERLVHQLHPAVTSSLIDLERRMSCAEAGVSSLRNVTPRTSEPKDQEVAKALFSAFAILLRIHRSQQILPR